MLPDSGCAVPRQTRLSSTAWLRWRKDKRLDEMDTYGRHRRMVMVSQTVLGNVQTGGSYWKQWSAYRSDHGHRWRKTQRIQPNFSLTDWAKQILLPLYRRKDLVTNWERNVPKRRCYKWSSKGNKSRFWHLGRDHWHLIKRRNIEKYSWLCQRLKFKSEFRCIYGDPI
jgi:hypothetical protein